MRENQPRDVTDGNVEDDADVGQVQFLQSYRRLRLIAHLHKEQARKKAMKRRGQTASRAIVLDLETQYLISEVSDLMTTVELLEQRRARTEKRWSELVEFMREQGEEQWLRRNAVSRDQSTIERTKAARGLLSQFTIALRPRRYEREFSELKEMIRENGRPRLAPYMSKLTTPGPFRTVADLHRAMRNKRIKWDQVGYHPLRHEFHFHPTLWRNVNRPHVVHRCLGMAVAVTWDDKHGFRRWHERDAEKLIKELSKYRIIVGANLISFDYGVLERYVPGVRSLLGFRTIDLLGQARWGLFLMWLTNELRSQRLTKRKIEEVLLDHDLFPGSDGQDVDRSYNRFLDDLPADHGIWQLAYGDLFTLRTKLRPRVSLASLAKGTLGEKKQGKASNAPELYRAGRMKELVRYCEKDVALARDIFRYGLENGSVRVDEVEVPVRFHELARRLARTTRRAGPDTETRCAFYQRDLLADAPPLLPVERFF